MAHGSKKWIVAYDGKIKRSNDRTKKDYYRDLHWWDEYGHSWRWRNYRKTGDFCPQCKHVAKYAHGIEDDNRNRITEQHERAAIEYDQKFGRAVQLWDAYYKDQWRESEIIVDGKSLYFPRPEPRISRPPDKWRWIRDRVGHGEYDNWTFNARTYLCFKCEYKYETKRAMWSSNHLPGDKKRYNYTVKQQRKEYRNKVRNLMQNERYDDICPRRDGWLD